MTAGLTINLSNLNMADGAAAETRERLDMDDVSANTEVNKATGKLPGTARVVVIGGGSVGASVLYHLAEKGWTDVVLLEKNELTSGSTWHAAGNCPNFVGSWTMMKIQSYSTSLYRELGAKVDYPMNYHVTGAIRLAHSRQRMEEFRHVERMGRQMGVEFQEMSPSEMQEVYPFLETHDLYLSLIHISEPTRLV